MLEVEHLRRLQPDLRSDRRGDPFHVFVVQARVLEHSRRDKLIERQVGYEWREQSSHLLRTRNVDLGGLASTHLPEGHDWLGGIRYPCDNLVKREIEKQRELEQLVRPRGRSSLQPLGNRLPGYIQLAREGCLIQARRRHRVPDRFRPKHSPHDREVCANLSTSVNKITH